MNNEKEFKEKIVKDGLRLLKMEKRRNETKIK